MVWIWLAIAVLLGGCQVDDRSAERQFYYGNYRAALVRVADDWANPKTQATAKQFLSVHGQTLMGALTQDLDRASNQAWALTYLEACAAIVPVVDRLPQVFLEAHPFPHRQQCLTARLTAIQQWRESLKSKDDPLQALDIWENIQAYDIVTEADQAVIAKQRAAVTRAVEFQWYWEEPLQVDALDSTAWMARVATGMAPAVMAQLQASDTPYYVQIPSADYQIQVRARVVQTDTMTAPVWAYDQLRFSKTEYGVARWYTRNFQYRVYDRDYTLQAIAQVAVYHQGVVIAEVPINEQVSHRIELGDPTLDLPIQYRDLQFPADYQLRVQARIQLDTEALVTQLSDQVYASVAAAVNSVLF